MSRNDDASTSLEVSMDKEISFRDSEGIDIQQKTEGPISNAKTLVFSEAGTVPEYTGAHTRPPGRVDAFHMLSEPHTAPLSGHLSVGGGPSEVLHYSARDQAMRRVEVANSPSMEEGRGSTGGGFDTSAAASSTRQFSQTEEQDHCSHYPNIVPAVVLITSGIGYIGFMIFFVHYLSQSRHVVSSGKWFSCLALVILTNIFTFLFYFSFYALMFSEPGVVPPTPWIAPPCPAGYHFATLPTSLPVPRPPQQYPLPFVQSGHVDSSGVFPPPAPICHRHGRSPFQDSVARGGGQEEFHCSSMPIHSSASLEEELSEEERVVADVEARGAGRGIKPVEAKEGSTNTSPVPPFPASCHPSGETENIFVSHDSEEEQQGKGGVQFAHPECTTIGRMFGQDVNYVDGLLRSNINVLGGNTQNDLPVGLLPWSPSRTMFNPYVVYWREEECETENAAEMTAVTHNDEISVSNVLLHGGSTEVSLSSESRAELSTQEEHVAESALLQQPPSRMGTSAPAPVSSSSSVPVPVPVSFPTSATKKTVGRKTILTERLRFCSFCQQYMPDRAYHCLQCRQCVYMYDHHCNITNTCVGQNNYKIFFTFVLYSLLYCTSSLITMLLGIFYYKGFGAFAYPRSAYFLPLCLIAGFWFFFCLCLFIQAMMAGFHFGLTTEEFVRWYALTKERKKMEAEAEAHGGDHNHNNNNNTLKPQESTEPANVSLIQSTDASPHTRLFGEEAHPPPPSADSASIRTMSGSANATTTTEGEEAEEWTSWPPRYPLYLYQHEPEDFRAQRIRQFHIAVLGEGWRWWDVLIPLSPRCTTPAERHPATSPSPTSVLTTPPMPRTQTPLL